MPSARETFKESAQALGAAALEPILADGAPTNQEHNARALVFRNGLAIISFARLELFLRDRAAEVVSSIARAGLGFTELPDDLREACTYGAVKALAYQAEMRRRQGEDPTSLIQSHTQKISTSSNPTFIVSELSLGWDKPNLTQEDVKKILASFNIKDAWNQMRLFAARSGISSPSLQDAFRNAANRRHQAAHRGNSNALLPDLQAFVNDAVGIAIGFDALLSRAAKLIVRRDPSFLSGAYKVDQNDIRLRFLHIDGPTLVREVEEGHARAVRRHRRLDAGIRSAEANARAHGEVVVVVNKKGLPVDWVVTDV